MWFFTGKGDQGSSSLFDGERLPKSSLEFELIGSLDEVTALIGLAVSFSGDDKITAILKQIQKELSSLMGIIAGAEEDLPASRFNLPEAIHTLEKWIDDYGRNLDNPHGFIFSGSTTMGAALDVARAGIRRSERTCVRYAEKNQGIDKNILAYLNRLSSLLFILRLFVDQNSP